MISKKEYEVVLKTKEPFRIGGKEDPLRGQENPVAIVGERIVVPGPSLKGAYRAELERFLIDSYFDKEKNCWQEGKQEMKPCIPSPPTQLSKDEETLINSKLYREQGCHYPCTHRCGDIKHTICPVCYILGANGLNGFVRIPFLYSEILSPSELYSARIDRATNTVTQGTNRPYCIVPEGIEFKGVLTIMLADDILKWTLGQKRPLGDRTGGDLWLSNSGLTQDQLIKDLIIDRIQNIELLGGYKSKGCGKVEITVNPA